MRTLKPLRQYRDPVLPGHEGSESDPPGEWQSWPPPPEAGDVEVNRGGFRTYRAHYDGNTWRWESLGTPVIHAGRWRLAPPDAPASPYEKSCGLALGEARVSLTRLLEMAAAISARVATRAEDVVAWRLAYGATRLEDEIRAALAIARSED